MSRAMSDFGDISVVGRVQIPPALRIYPTHVVLLYRGGLINSQARQSVSVQHSSMRHLPSAAASSSLREALPKTLHNHDNAEVTLVKNSSASNTCKKQ